MFLFIIGERHYDILWQEERGQYYYRVQIL
jgi:hypothetical protein